MKYEISTTLFNVFMFAGVLVNALESSDTESPQASSPEHKEAVSPPGKPPVAPVQASMSPVKTLEADPDDQEFVLDDIETHMVRFLSIMDSKVLPVYSVIAVVGGLLFLLCGSCISFGVSLSPDNTYYPLYAFLTNTSTGNDIRVLYTIAALFYGAYTFVWRFDDLGIIKTLGASCAMVWIGLLPHIVRSLNLIIR